MREQTLLDSLAAVLGAKYEVLQWIGGGGMAEVFLARHRVHGGLFAVKVLAEDLASDAVIVERFLQEARTAASLSGHANIVPIFDVGQDQGLHYIIMQYVEGEDLAAYLQRVGRLSPVQAVQLLMQVVKALVWAHSKGVVHRDLKPANVRLDRYGRAIVLDFGIAKAGQSASSLTMAGERLGTPYYMAPEQVRGEQCDARSDLYSVGVIFFELLTGRRPFTGETVRAVEYAHLSTPAPSPAEYEASVGTEYCAVVLRLLEKDPAARYQTAEALLDDLKALDVGRSTEVLTPQVTEEIARLSQATLEAPPVRLGEPSQSATRAPTLREPAPPTARAPTLREPAAPPAPPRRSRAWLFLTAGGAVIALALGAALVLRRGPPPAKLEPDLTVGKPEAYPTGMQLVPAGNFTFGDASQQSPNPVRTIFLPGFYVDQSEVSNAAYKRFCDATGQPAPEAPPWDPNYFLKPDYPVVNVSRREAAAFAAWAGKRLPTEEEWEKAARGSDGRVYPWGNSSPKGNANLAGVADGFENTAPVDSFPEGASPYGARNMAGNVWEWTATPYPVSAKEIADMKALLPSVDPQWAVIKGGNFATEELWLRTYMRRGFPGSGRSPFIGFRCVQDAKTNTKQN